MVLFKQGDCAEVIATGRKGLVTDRVRTKVTVEFFDKNYIVPERITYSAKELKHTDAPVIKSSQLRPFVRGELSLEQVSDGVNYLSDKIESDSKQYSISAVDLLAGLNVYEKKPLEDTLKWIDIIMQFEDELVFADNPWDIIVDEIKEKDILNLAYNEMDDFKWYRLECYDDVFLDALPDLLMKLRDYLEIWVESKGERYPESIVLAISQQFDSDSIDRQSEKTQRLYKNCLDYLCDKKIPEAIQRRGYCYYCGTKIYPNDWIKARDSFIEYYQMTGDASAANTLGYIYYYGRCNGGVPEYEKAFKYFSIGHAFTYFESTYKLADMFAHGYGVVKNKDTAYRLYWGVYEQTIKPFIKGDYENKFADAALRMGNCYRDGIGVEKNLKLAYYYYLQADLAIRKRTATVNYYGDTVVFSNIQKALEEVRKEYTETGRVEKFDYPLWTKWVLYDQRSCRLKIKELAHGALSLDVSLMKRYYDDVTPMMLITVPQADYCEIRKKIKLKTARNSTYKIYGDAPEIIFDYAVFEYDTKKTIFYLFEKPVGEICTEAYSFTAPAVKKELSGDVYHFVTVCFEESGRCYDYLCDDESVKVGDRVVVVGYDGETTVNVVDVSEKYESQLGLPLERYKHIVRKA